MAKTSMICPFSRKLCIECELYRGKHYFLCYCAKYRGNLGQSNEQVKFNAAPSVVNFQTFGEAGKSMDPERMLPGR